MCRPTDAAASSIPTIGSSTPAFPPTCSASWDRTRSTESPRWRTRSYPARIIAGATRVPRRWTLSIRRAFSGAGYEIIAAPWPLPTWSPNCANWVPPRRLSRRFGRPSIAHTSAGARSIVYPRTRVPATASFPAGSERAQGSDDPPRAWRALGCRHSGLALRPAGNPRPCPCLPCLSASGWSKRH